MAARRATDAARREKSRRQACPLNHACSGRREEMNVAERGLAHLPPTTVTATVGQFACHFACRCRGRRRRAAGRPWGPRGASDQDIASRDLRTTDGNCGKTRACGGKNHDSAAVQVPEHPAGALVIRHRIAECSSSGCRNFRMSVESRAWVAARGAVCAGAVVILAIGMAIARSPRGLRRRDAGCG